MPEPTVDSIAPGGKVNLSDAPAAIDDATFDSLFPAEPTPVATSSQEPAPAPAAAAAQPSQPANGQPSQPFIKGTKSVYNTPEAAVEGINQKDALIEQLRQRYALTTGIDPITGQPVAASPQAPQSGIDYYQQPDAYIKDAYDAMQKGNTQRYRDVQAKFLFDTLKPLQPVIQRAAREQAIDVVAQEIKEAKPFIGSPQYDQTLESVPDLRDAIKTAEADPQFHHRLPGLYKIAYLAGQGRQLPEILQAQAAQRPTNPPAQPRPTLNPSTPAPPQPTARPSFKTIDGIKATIAEAESRGMKLDF